MVLSKLTIRPYHRGNGLLIVSSLKPIPPISNQYSNIYCINKYNSIACRCRPNTDRFDSTRRSFLFFTSKRFFKPPNSFQNHNESYSAELIGKLATAIPIVVFSIAAFNIPSIWANYVPNFIKRPLIAVANIFRFRKADSLSKDNVNGFPNQELYDSGLLDNILYYFNIKREQYSKAGGFRDKKIIEYENRIRLYSNPDKIFRYFASVKIVYNNNDSEIYMTPDDFLRALTPGIKQPDGLGLDQFRKIDLSKNINSEDTFEMSTLLSQILTAGKYEFKYPLKPDSIFYKLSRYGLINFTDFLFLLTVISVSRRHFEIAFRMFDLNGDGDVEYEEFEKVQSAILAQTSIGKKMGKSVHYKGISSAISKYFFGVNLKNRLTIDNFMAFQQQLQNELLTLEFEQKNPNPETGKIRELEFAELMVAYAALNEKKRNKMIKRVIQKFSSTESVGISLEEYLNFFRFLRNINDVDVALTFYHIAGASIDQATLKHVAQTVAHVELSDHLVEVVFTLFDDNDDGQLSNREFICVLKERLKRGLSKPKDTGLLKIMYTIFKSLVTFNF